MKDMLIKPEEQRLVYVYHGTDMKNLGQILFDGYLMPVDPKSNDKEKAVYFTFKFSKAASYGDVVFEVPISRLPANKKISTRYEEVAVFEPVEVRLSYANDARGYRSNKLSGYNQLK